VAAVTVTTVRYTKYGGEDDLIEADKAYEEKFHPGRQLPEMLGGGCS